MHFTLWPSLTDTRGAHTEIAWPDFLDFLSFPTVAESKAALEGWSPARFTDNRRAAANVEAVSLIGLDFDSGDFTLDALVDAYASAGYSGALHTTFSHTPERPKCRVVLRLSRDVTGAEYRVLWSVYAAEAPAPVDAATKDPSRLWFVPAHAPGAPYEWRSW